MSSKHKFRWIICILLSILLAFEVPVIALAEDQTIDTEVQEQVSEISADTELVMDEDVELEIETEPVVDTEILDEEVVNDADIDVEIKDENSVPDEAVVPEIKIEEVVKPAKKELPPIPKSERPKPAKMPRTETGIIPAQFMKSKDSGPSAQSTGQAVHREFVSNRALIQLRSAGQMEGFINELEAEGYKVTAVLKGEQPLLRIDAAEGAQSTFELLQRYYVRSEVLSAEPDYVFYPQSVPNDPYYNDYQWAHNNQGASYNGSSGTAGIDLQSQDAWDIYSGSGQTIVAVIDSGVMLNHPDLQDSLWDGTNCVDENNLPKAGGCPNHGYDFFDLDNNPSDEWYHGTFVAGIIAGRGNNGLGIAGVNWNGNIMALKVGTVGGTFFTYSSIIPSVYFAVYNGARVINASFNASGESTILTAALQFARDNGVLVVAAAGNASLDLDNPANLSYPCQTDLDNIICVASSNIQGGLGFLSSGGGSNYGGNQVDIAAPGSDILSTSVQLSNLYTNSFSNGITDLQDFTLSGGSDWGVDTVSGNLLMKSHISGQYLNDEDSLAELNQNFDLSQVGAGTLSFELSCDTDDAFDTLLTDYPVDGLAVEFSNDGGFNYEEVFAYNGFLAEQWGNYVGVGPNGMPLISIGLIDRDFVNTFRFRFHFFSDAQTTGSGCDIDNINLHVASAGVYGYGSGTSFAAPMVAGLASLIWDYSSGLTYSEIKNLIYSSGDSLPGLSGQVITGKQINAYRALASLTDPAVVSLRGFFSNGGVEFLNSQYTNSSVPFFSWTAPTAQGIISGYSYALDGVPDVVIDTSDTFLQLNLLAEGNHSLSVVGVNDMNAQGTAATFSFTIDTIPPSDPADVSVNGGVNIINIGNAAATEFSAIANENVSVNYIFSDGVNPNVTGTSSVPAGSFDISGIDLSSLTDGNITLSVTYTDLAGNLSNNVQLAALKDTQVSSASGVLLNGGITVNSIAKDSVTLEFITNEAGNAIYEISDGLNPVVSGTKNVAGSGIQTVTGLDLSTLSDGNLSVSVVFTDSAGNASAAGTGSIAKDTLVSAATDVLLNNGSMVNSLNENSVALTFSVAEVGNASYSVSDGSGQVTGSLAITQAGAQTVNALDVSALNDSNLNISVTFTDSAGNVSSLSSSNLIKDTDVNPATNVLLNNGQIVTSANQNSVNLTFETLEAGSAVYNIGGIVGNIAVSAGLTTVPALNVSGLPDGTINYSVLFTDTAGNVSSLVNNSLSKDATVNVPASVSLNGGIVVNSSAQSLVNLSFVVDEAGTAAYVISSGTQNVNGALAVSPGTVTVYFLDLSGLDDGTLISSVVLTDSVGNVSAAGTNSLAKDTQVTSATNVLLNNGVAINSSSQNSVALTFAITELGNFTYSLSDGINPALIGSLAVTQAGAQTVNNLNVSALNDGNLTSTVLFTDSAGNVSLESVSIVSKDTVVDAVTNMLLNNGQTMTAALQNSVSLIFDSLEAGTAIYDIGGIIGNVAVIGAGVTTVSGVNVSGLADGPINYSVLFTDSSGNASAQVNDTVTKDSTANVPGSVLLNNGVIVNNSSKSAVVLEFSVDESGSAAYTISDGVNNVSGNLTINSVGAQTVNFLNLSGLSDGNLSVSVVLTDSVGNVSAAGTGSLVKDTLVNSATDVLLNNGLTINSSSQGSVALSFAVTELGNAEYRISDGVNPDLTGSLAVTQSGAQTANNLDVSTLNDGPLNVSVNFTDSAGNSGSQSSSTISKDTEVSPATDLSLNNGQIIKAVDQLVVDLEFSVSETGSVLYIISDGVNNVSGNYLVTLAGVNTITGLDLSSLADGPLNVELAFMDTAGNISSITNGTAEKDAIVLAPVSVNLNNGLVINSLNQTSVDLTFTVAEAGSVQYQITDGNEVVVNTVSVALAGVYTVVGIDLSTLDDPMLDISVVLTDSAGNTSSAGTANVAKDTQVISAADVLLNNAGVINSINQNSVALTFSVSEFGNASYSVSDGVNPPLTGSMVIGASGAQTLNLDVSSLNDGVLNVSIIFTDAVGNISGAGLGSGTKDATAPVAPSGVVLNNGLGINSLNRNSVTLDGVAGEASTMMYAILDGVNPAITGSLVLSQAGAFAVDDIDLSHLNDGNIHLYVTLTDSAGNISLDAHVVSLKDTQASAVPNIILGRSRRGEGGETVGTMGTVGTIVSEGTEGSEGTEEIEVDEIIQYFDDVSKRNLAFEEIHYLRKIGAVNGAQGKNVFLPKQMIDRAQALKILLSIVEYEIPEFVDEAPFSDVEAGAWFAPVISLAKELGFISGYSDGTFVPWGYLNRAEAVKLAYDILEVETDDTVVSPFADVDNDMWYRKYIVAAYRRGLFTAENKTSGLYIRPTDLVSREEFAVLVVGVYGLRDR